MVPATRRGGAYSGNIHSHRRDGTGDSLTVDPQILIQSQRAWLQERTACGADLDCLRRGYGARIGQMRDMQP
ncbi:hypothetical protein CRX59_06955 [Burkholderia thailandensis]|nr:hypothetical protein CRX59_06955 [Burkholderia thailandensis]PNE81316.1 hypothetical protein A8H34_26100 [Burkholderia thailandensis]PNE87260.1 hypothetical protein A8H30_25760 [Burkholderia thailandensis]